MTDASLDAPTNGTDPVVEAVLRAHRALVGITVRSLSAVNEDVTLPQFRTLVVIAERGPQTVSALADHLAVHASTMTRMCNRLVSRGMVSREPSAADRREVVIALSPLGASVVDRVVRARQDANDAAVARVPAAERDMVIRALDTFAAGAGGADQVASEAMAGYIS